MKPQPHFIELDEVESTMAEAADRLAHGEIGPWTTIIARRQTRGRGRRNRQWDAEPGDALLATVVVPLAIPPERVGLIALATGLAVADAVSQWGVPVSLKWPTVSRMDRVALHARADPRSAGVVSPKRNPGGAGLHAENVPNDQTEG